MTHILKILAISLLVFSVANAELIIVSQEKYDKVKTTVIPLPYKITSFRLKHENDNKLDFFFESGVGMLSTEEDIYRTNDYNLPNNRLEFLKSTAGALGRVGININKNVALYGEVSISRGKLEYASLSFIDFMAGARYTFENDIYVFGSAGRQKVTLRSTKIRTVGKVGVGYKFLSWVSAEVSFKKSDKLYYPSSSASGEEIGLWAVINF